MISSSTTFFMKVVFPTLWISAFGMATGLLWFGGLRGKGGHLAPPEMRWTFLVIWISASTLILKLCATLKKVRLGDGVLYTSNYRREIVVPTSEIMNVTENKRINIHPVTIYFRKPTEFGDEVTFMPKMHMAGPWSSHPVVDELKKAAGRV